MYLPSSLSNLYIEMIEKTWRFCKAPGPKPQNLAQFMPALTTHLQFSLYPSSNLILFVVFSHVDSVIPVVHKWIWAH